MIDPTTRAALDAVARIRQMTDAWEQRLPETIRTPAVVSALRAALETVPAVSLPPADQTAPSRRAGLRDEIAAAVVRLHESGGLFALDAGEDGRIADAVLPVLYREWPWLRAEAEDAAPADQTALPVAEAVLAAVEAALCDELVPSARAEALAGIAAMLPATTGQTADRAAIRDRIAAALAREDAHNAGYDHGFAASYGADDETDGFVDAVLAVLPATTDQTADAPVAECSAQHRSFDDGRLCIRAAQHQGDHIDERGYHWSDTVAVYPVADGTFRPGTDVRAALRRMADETQPAETEVEPTAEEIARDHVTTLHLIGEQLATIEGWFWEHLADVRAAGQPAAGARQDETAAAPCVECGHPKAVHGEGDDPVTPGQCADCPDDEDRHDYQPAAGSRQDEVQPLPAPTETAPADESPHVYMDAVQDSAAWAHAFTKAEQMAEALEHVEAMERLLAVYRRAVEA